MVGTTKNKVLPKSLLVKLYTISEINGRNLTISSMTPPFAKIPIQCRNGFMKDSIRTFNGLPHELLLGNLH